VIAAESVNISVVNRLAKTPKGRAVFMAKSYIFINASYARIITLPERIKKSVTPKE